METQELNHSLPTEHLNEVLRRALSKLFPKSKENVSSFVMTWRSLEFPSGVMSIPEFFLVVSWTLTLCPQGSPTSLGHPLPTPLKENHIFLPASGSNIPVMNKGQTSPPAHIKMPQDHSDDDYYDYDSILTIEPQRPDRPQLLPPRCNYNHCHHLQVPCVELRKVSQCMCPGITDPTVAPEPPRLQTIHVSEAGASVHWCAPSSTVQEYRLWYRPVNGPFISGPALNSTFRLAAVSVTSDLRELVERENSLRM